MDIAYKTSIDCSLISAMVIREDGESRHKYFYFSPLCKGQTYTNIRAYSVIVGELTMLKFREPDLLIHEGDILDCRLASWQDLTYS